MKFRLSALFLTALLAASLAAPALADMIWYPENSFIDAHTRECDFTIRRGVANSPKGYIDGRKSPDGQVIYQAENGRPVTVYATYQDWGCIGCPEEGAEPSDDWLENDARGAWVPLADLALVYDRIAFEADFAGELVPGDGEQIERLIEARNSDAIVLWPYPNAEQALSAYAEGGEAYEDFLLYGFKKTFTDEEGFLWGMPLYHPFLGYKEVWVCLSAPDAGDGHTELFQYLDRTYIPNPNPRVVSVRALPEVTLYPAREPVPPAADYLPAALAGGAVVLSGGALWVFYRKKKWRGGTP